MKDAPYIGQLKYPITVEAEQKGRTSTGEENITGHNVIASLKAYLDKQDADDGIDGKLRSLYDRSYVVRFRDEILEDFDNLVIRDSGKLYRVYNVIELVKRRYLKILVTKYE